MPTWTYPTVVETDEERKPSKARATKGSYWVEVDFPDKEPIQVRSSAGYEVECYRNPFSKTIGNDPWDAQFSPKSYYRRRDLKLFFRPATEEEIAWAVMRFS